MRLAADERRDLADLLDTLTSGQWAQPSLCEGWTVRDVVAHVISYEGIGYFGLVGPIIRTGLRPGRLNQVRLHAHRDHQPERLVRLLRSQLTPRGLTAGFGGGIGLTDCLIHHQDIRRPLNLPRDVPPDRLIEALDFSLRAPLLPSRRNAAGVRIVATDVNWRHGRGPEIEGPGESLLMALAGRAAALSDLDGAGLPTLAARIGP
jgi:uncharacterized protein (TIGR03083 family)